MKVFVKESLYVLDYEDNIVDCIFNSDDHRTPGYAYNISIEDSNTGYSNLTFTMPTKIIPMPTAMENAKDAQEAVLNPKLALLTPLVKIRYERQVIYTGEQPITVSIPTGYGDTTIYQEITYNPGDLIEYDHDGNQGCYVMDYIVQPTDKKRSGLEVSITFTAIDYPRFNLSKKKLGLTINENTITRGDWSIYEKEPMSIAGTVQYVKWTQQLSDSIFGPNANIPLDWDPSIMSGYPLTEEQIATLLRRTDVWTYGITATVFYWPISQTGRFEGVLYNRDDYLTLNLYEKNLVQVLGEGAKLDGNKNYTLVKYTWLLAENEEETDRYVKSRSLTDHELLVYGTYKRTGEKIDPLFLGVISEGGAIPVAHNENEWYVAETPVGVSLDFYGYTWGYYDQGAAYLTPNNPCNYLNWILENTNWKIKTRTDKVYRGIYFDESEFPTSGAENEYLLLRGPKPGEIVDEWERPVYRGHATTPGDLPDGNNVDNWAIVRDGTTSVMYRWDGTKCYLSRDGVSKIFTNVYIWDGTAWVITTDMWIASIDKEMGVLYDVDQVETEVAKPDGSTGDLFETTQLRSTLTASDSNCYNAITELSKSFQLYPVFDCVCREVALHIFCGKNYGLTYKLGKSLENTTVKEDGEKVITKLRCYGGNDAKGSEKINLGDANRQYRKLLVGFYNDTSELPLTNIDGIWAIVNRANDENEVYFWDNGSWVRGTKNEDGSWSDITGTYVVDPETGAPYPWDPNDPMYIQARSPYGTEYIYNFKWMYDNGWMTKQEILALYAKSLEIQELNKGFLDTYTEDYKYAYEMSVKAGVDYQTNQDEYLACLTSMEDHYYRVPASPSEGEFAAFYQAPADARPGISGFNNEEPTYHYIDMYHCYNCGHTRHEAFEIEDGNYVCPNCRSKMDSIHTSVRIPLWENFETQSVQNNPKSKGFYREVINDVGDDNARYINVATIIPCEEFEPIGNQQKFKLGNQEVYDKSSHLYNWNDYVIKWQEYYGLQLDNLALMNKYIKICDELEESYNIYQKQLNELEDYIQDNWGDYIVEGKYADDTICYTNILLAKSLEASDEYCIPKVSYTASVVDSSGLIEYRMPLADTYNDLVRTLHNSGQIVPHAGDYVRLIDEQLGLYGTPAVITSIKRVLDNPQSNTITVDTSYTDDEQFVGNIITATNTVLNNQDIYARTAIIKADGTIEGGSLNKSLEQNSGDNIAFVGTKGSSLLDSTGLTVVDQGNADRKMRYAGNGVFGTNDNGKTWQSMLTPNGINANYINAGSIDTKHIQIMSGQHAKVVMDDLGLTVKKQEALPYHLPTGTVTYGSTTVPNWEESGANLAAFIGVDRNNNPQLYVGGQLVAKSGSKIGNWIVGERDLYDTNQQVYLSPDGITATIGGVSRSNLTLKAGSNFGVNKSGNLYASSADISGKIVVTDSSSSVNTGQVGGLTASNTGLSSGDTIVLSPTGYTGTITIADGVSSSGPWAIYSKGNFGVTTGGTLWAKNGKFGGEIQATSGKISNITAANITVASGKIGGWTINETTLTGGNTTLNSNGTITTKNLSCTGGSLSISNGGWFSIGRVSTHPIVSGLNLDITGGLNFRTGAGVNTAGTPTGAAINSSASGGIRYGSGSGDHMFSGGDFYLSSGASTSDYGVKMETGSGNITASGWIKSGDIIRATDRYEIVSANGNTYHGNGDTAGKAVCFRVQTTSLNSLYMFLYGGICVGFGTGPGAMPGFTDISEKYDT